MRVLFLIAHHQDCCSEPSVASSTVVQKLLILGASYEPSPAADHAALPVPLVPLFTVSRDCATLINLGQQLPVEGQEFQSSVSDLDSSWCG
jgi:hypothetical protein